MKLRLAAPDAADRHRPHPGPARHLRANGEVHDRRADAARRGGARPASALVSRGGADDRRPAGPQPRHARRLARPRRPGVRHAGGRAGAATRRSSPRATAASREIAAAEFFQDYLETALEPHEVLTEIRLADADRLGLRLREVQPPPGGLGDGGRVARWSSRRAACVSDVRIGLTHMGSDPAAGDRGRGGAARAAARRRARSPRRPSRPRRAPTRRPTSTPRRTTSATWRGCCAGAR